MLPALRSIDLLDCQGIYFNGTCPSWIGGGGSVLVVHGECHGIYVLGEGGVGLAAGRGFASWAGSVELVTSSTRISEFAFHQVGATFVIDELVHIRAASSWVDN